jgi:hypothetical protein
LLQRLALLCTALAAAASCLYVVLLLLLLLLRCTTVGAQKLYHAKLQQLQHMYSLLLLMTNIAHNTNAAIMTAFCLQANCCVSLGSNDKWQGCETSSNLYTCVSQFDDKPLAVCCS